MEYSEPLDLVDKKHINSWLTSEDGKLFVKTIRDMYENHLDLAQSMYLKVVNPNEQISVQVNQAVGIKEVLDFIDSLDREIKEAKKEADKKSEKNL